jgi:hypothetical protein
VLAPPVLKKAPKRGCRRGKAAPPSASGRRRGPPPSAVFSSAYNVRNSRVECVDRDVGSLHLLRNRQGCSLTQGIEVDKCMHVLAWNIGKALSAFAGAEGVRQRLSYADIIILTEIGVSSAEDFAQRFTLPLHAGFTWHVKPRPFLHPRARSYSGGVAIGVGPAYAACCSVVPGVTSCDGLLWVRIEAAATGLARDLYIAGVYVQPKLPP